MFQGKMSLYTTGKSRVSMVCKAFHLVRKERFVIIFCSPTTLARDACPSPALLICVTLMRAV